MARMSKRIKRAESVSGPRPASAPSNARFLPPIWEGNTFACMRHITGRSADWPYSLKRIYGRVRTFRGARTRKADRTRVPSTRLHLPQQITCTRNLVEWRMNRTGSNLSDSIHPAGDEAARTLVARNTLPPILDSPRQRLGRIFPASPYRIVYRRFRRLARRNIACSIRLPCDRISALTCAFRETS